MPGVARLGTGLPTAEHGYTDTAVGKAHLSPSLVSCGSVGITADNDRLCIVKILLLRAAAYYMIQHIYFTILLSEIK